MENFEVKIDVDVKATMVLSEVELRALDALAGYGIEPFLKVFYAQMGKHYLQPHEAGLRALFKTIGEVTPGPLRQATSHRHWLREAAKERPMARVKAAPYMEIQVLPTPNGTLWSRFWDWVWLRHLTRGDA